MTTTHHRACNLCEAICGLTIEVENGKIMHIEGDKNDPLSKGHICPKAFALKDDEATKNTDSLQNIYLCRQTG
jgi:anaerobic selenocysteine-containing dehydrogenase